MRHTATPPAQPTAALVPWTVLALLFLPACAPPPEPAPPPPSPTVTGPAARLAYSPFPSGLQLVAHEDPTATRMAVSVSYRVGAADEPAGKKGLAWLSAELTSRARHGGPTAQPLVDRLSALGAQPRSVTTYDETEFTSTVPEKQLTKLLTLEAERMREPLGQLTEENFLQARRRAVETLRQRYAEEGSGAQLRWLHETLLPGHVYGRPLHGTPESVARLTLEDVRAFVKASYDPAHAILVVSGPLPLADVKFLVSQALRGVTGAGQAERTPAVKRTPPPFPDEPRDGEALAVVHGPVKAPQLSMAWTLPGLHSGRYLEPLLAAGGLGVWVRGKLQGDARVKGVRSEYRELDGVTLLVVTLELRDDVRAEEQVRAVADRARDSMGFVVNLMTGHQQRMQYEKTRQYNFHDSGVGPTGNALLDASDGFAASGKDLVADSRLGLNVHAYALKQLQQQLAQEPTLHVARMLRASGRPDVLRARQQQYQEALHSEGLMPYLSKYVRAERARMMLVLPELPR
jgi:zinc protease